MTEDEREIQLAFIRALADDPHNKTTRLVFADWLDEHGDAPRAEILRTGNIPLTDQDKVAVGCLYGCRFAPATWDKRFSKDLFARYQETEPYPNLTPKQYLWLWVLLRRYRRTVGNARIRDVAEERYNHYIGLLDIKHLKPVKRMRTKKTDDRTFLFDE